MTDVFLSYRRDGGEALAEILYTKLTERGYNVFYDKESLKSGLFEPKLYTEIEQCEDFVLILPPHALDRCLESEDDWVRCEIRHAILHKKNIIPVLMRGFSFPPDLPDDIRHVSGANGVSFENMEFIDARVDRIAELMISVPSRRRKKKKAHKKKRGRSGNSRKKGRVVTALERVAGYLWKHTLSHIAIVFLLLFLIVHFGTEVARYTVNSSVDQWVVPDILAVGSPLLMSPGVSYDNTLFAKPMGDGLVTIWQIVPKSKNTRVIDCHTELGNDRILSFFDRENRDVFLISDTRMEVYNTHTGGFQYGYDFVKGNPAWTLYSITVPEQGESLTNFAVLWGEETSEEGSGYSLRACGIFSMTEEPQLLEEIPLEGMSFIGYSDPGYLLFVDEKQDPCVIDLQQAAFVPSDQIKTVMKESLCGHLEGSNEVVDESRRYFVHTVHKTAEYEGYTDIMIYDMAEGKYVSSRTYTYPFHFSFSSEGHYLILYAVADQQRKEWVPEIRSVSYLDAAGSNEVILNEEDINKLFVTDALFEEPYFDIMQFSESDTLLVIIDNRIQIIDTERKRRIASSNDFLKKEYAESIQIVQGTEQNGCAYITLISEVDDPEGSEPLKGMTLLRFSFAEDEGQITVWEDAYDGMLWEVLMSALMLVLDLTVLIAFEIYGFRHVKQPDDAFSRALTALEKKKVE